MNKLLIFSLVWILTSCSSSEQQLQTQLQTKELIEYANTKKYYKPASYGYNQSVILGSQIELDKLKNTDNNQKFAEHYADMGMAYSNLGLNELSSIYYSKAYALEPDSALRAYDLALELNYTGSFIDAEKILKKAITIEPTNSHYLRGFGNVYFSNDIYPEAESLYLKSIKAAQKETDKYYSAIILL